jgi:membrane-bound serine protease (ClpP class)
MLFDAPEANFRVSWWVIAPTVAATAGLFMFVVTAGVRALARRPVLDEAGLVGKTGIARDRLAPAGQVSVQGEIWRAVVEGDSVEEGTPVRVVAVDGLTLRVVRNGAEGGRS